MCVWSHNKGETGSCARGGGGWGAYVTNKDGNVGKALGVKEKPLQFKLRELFQKGPENSFHSVSVNIWVY